LPPGENSGILFGRSALLWLFGALLLLRATGFAVGLTNLDECDFWLFGRMMREHALPYVGVADIKPPLTYLAFLAAGLLFGPHRTLAVPLLGLSVVFACALLLGATARYRSGDARTGLAAAWLTLWAGLCEGPSVNAEILMNLPSAAALYAYARAEREKRFASYFAAGVFAALASLFKLQAGILWPALGLATAWPALREGPSPARKRALETASVLSAGFVLPWALAALVCARGGYLAGAYDWVVRRNVFQISSAQVFALENVLPSIAAALFATAFAWWLALREARQPRDGFERALVVLLVLTLLPVSVGRRFYEHYFLQFVPPLALLGAPQLVALRDRFAGFSRARRAAVLVFALSAPVGNLAFTAHRALARGFPGQDSKALAIAAWLDEHTAPSDRVFMWGDYSAIYCLADRLPGTRYMRTAPQVGDFDPLHLPEGFDFRPYRSERDIGAALLDLEKNRPAIVLDTSPADVHRWSLFPLDAVPDLRRFIALHYREVGRPAGAVVYRLADAGEPAGPPSQDSERP